NLSFFPEVSSASERSLLQRQTPRGILFVDSPLRPDIREPITHRSDRAPSPSASSGFGISHKRLLSRLNCLLDIHFRVRSANEQRLVLRRRQINTGIQHLAMECGKGLSVAFCGGIPVANRARLEEPREHGAHAMGEKGNTLLLHSCKNSINE